MAQSTFSEAQKSMIEEFVHKLFEHEMDYETDAKTLCKFLGISEKRLKKEIQKSLKAQVMREVEEFKQTRFAQMRELLEEIVGDDAPQAQAQNVDDKTEAEPIETFDGHEDSSTYVQFDR